SEFGHWAAAATPDLVRRSVDGAVRRGEQPAPARQVGAAADPAAGARKTRLAAGTALRTALRTLALAGDRAGALALFEEFVSRLSRELGAEPDGETYALAERVRLERTWRLPRAVHEAERRSGSRRAPLVGRAVELERLTDA